MANANWDDVKDNEIKQLEPLDNTVVCECALVRPTTFPISTTTHMTGNEFRFPNIDNINLSPSPLDTRPRLFKPGCIDSNTHQRILASLYAAPPPSSPSSSSRSSDIKNRETDNEESDDDTINISLDEEPFNEETSNDQREHEIKQLTQLVRTTQPSNDGMANIIMQQLNDVLQTLPLPLSQSRTTTVTVAGNDKQVSNQLETVSSIVSTTATTTISKYPYPPVRQAGHPVKHHDRPYAEYGHLSREIIARECQFNLDQSRPISPPSLSNSSSSNSPSSSSSPPPTTAATVNASSSVLSSSSVNQQQPKRQRIIRLNAKSFAITSWTNVSKESVMNYIKHEFGIENIQYICISEEISEVNHRRHLHIQIIFKKKIDRRKAFLDEITRTHCHYQVTRNDCAWNEYIKKDGNYIEFNEFKSTKTRGRQMEWPPLSQSSVSSAPSSVHSSANTTAVNPNLTTVSTITPTAITAVTVAAAATTTTTTATTTAAATTATDITTTTAAINMTRAATAVAAAAGRTTTVEKQKQKETIAKQACNLAKTSVNKALLFMRDNAISTDFLRYSHWYKSTFTLVNLLEQCEMARIRTIIKEYTWPQSFPNCTPALRRVVDNWIATEFHRRSRAKCLILVGGTGTGKTTFAKSLPGQYNYFQGRWRLDSWKDSASYLIFDDIPWDKFDQLGFPPKKALLTQNGLTMVTDKYRPAVEINIRQPAIILLNPDDAGSLIRAEEEPLNDQQKHILDYWQQRAILYQIGSNEYFYKSNNHQNALEANNNNISNKSLPSSNINGSNQEPVRHTSITSDIFDELTQRAQHRPMK